MSTLWTREARKRFQARSERIAEQRELNEKGTPLFGDALNEAEAEVEAAEDDDEEVEEEASPPKKGPKKKKPRIPPDIPRTIVELPPKPEDLVCGCGKHKVRIGEETCEKVEFKPATVSVTKFVRPKMACNCCKDSGVTIAPVPEALLPNCFAAPSLLSFIAVSKYCDALPLYRQSSILERSGIHIQRSTFARWMVRLGEALQPLTDLLRQDILSASVVHADETTIQVLKEKGRAPQTKSYVWVLARGEDYPGVYCEYHPSRAHEVAVNLLADFHGCLVSDGYEAYGTAMRSRPESHSGCWDHARRPFAEAFVGKTPEGNSLAGFALKMIRKLYQIERELSDQTPAERLAGRQALSLPIVKELRKWLDEKRPRVATSSPTGKAMGYLERQWPKLLRFLENGKIPLSNQRAENHIRPLAVGRKNWLFADTPGGANASMRIYSLLMSAIANGLQPIEYLEKVIEELPACKTPESMKSLLPHKVAAAMNLAADFPFASKVPGRPQSPSR